MFAPSSVCGMNAISNRTSSDNFIVRVGFIRKDKRPIEML